MNQFTNNHFEIELFDKLPVGMLTIDQEYCVKRINDFARNQLVIGSAVKVTDSVHSDSAAAFEALSQSDVGASSEIQLSHGDNTVYTRFTVIAKHAEEVTFSIEETTEIIALGRQLKSGKQPERRFVHEISNALTTTIGYTELINMMLDEHESLSGEKLAAVKRYELEVFDGLKRADAIIKNKRQGASQQFSPAIPMNRKHVVVVDDEPQITDFLSELLRARQYKVTAFTDGASALSFYKENRQSVDLVIMDQVMPEMSGISLATELLALDIEQPIVLCTGDQLMIQEQNAGHLKIKHFLSKPIDINELTEMVSDIIDRE